MLFPSVHRDIKPNNILLTVAEGKAVVKLADFGQSKVLDLQASVSLFSQTAGVMGALGWTAPEVLVMGGQAGEAVGLLSYL